ncbi:MAG: hypothetical protein PHQ96_05510 [Candidatus Omnitrophica bacterium]|nr:hypothetical protein [Candidatus Omnitrophota bacterium]
MHHFITKREKLLLNSTMGVIIFGLAFHFIINPIFSENDNLNKELTVTRTKLKKYLWLISHKDVITENYKTFTSAYKNSEAHQPQVTALTEIEDMAKGAGIRIIDIRPQISTSGPSQEEIFVEIRTEGDMDGYLKFLYDVEDSLSLVKIKKFQLTAKPNTQSLEGSFSLSRPFTLE